MTNAIPWNTHDSMAMSWRSLRAMSRKLDTLLISVLLPVFMMLLFVYVFGSAMSVEGSYTNYVVPGVIVLCAGYGASTTAVLVASDLQHGVIDRFKSMPIVGSSVLVGHVVASLASNVVSTTIVILVALLTGFNPDAGVTGWVLAILFLTLMVIALSWVSAAIGLAVKNVEAASGATFFILFMPYLSSAFVPTDGLPGPLQPVAEYQPFTPIIETIRGLLLGTDIGNYGWIALLWLGGLLVLGFVVSSRLFARAGT